MRVVFRIAELEREVDGDGFILRQLVPLHALHVLIEPRVPSREWPNGQSPIRERYHLTPLPR